MIQHNLQQHECNNIQAVAHMQHHTVPHTTHQYHTVQCSTEQCRMVHRMTLHDITWHCTTLHRIASHYNRTPDTLPSYMDTIRYDTGYKFQNSIQKRNVAGDGSRRKPGISGRLSSPQMPRHKQILFSASALRNNFSCHATELLTNPS